MNNITVIPNELSASELEKFSENLYSLQQQIFDGVSKEEFIKYTILSSAEKTEIAVMINSKGEYVGYTATHYFEKTVKGKPTTIIKNETGILPEYRAFGNTSKILLKRAIKYKFTHPRRHSYSLACLVTPVTYYLMARNAYEVYPNVKGVKSEHIEEVRKELTDLFEMEPIEGQNEYVKKVGWIVRQSAEDQMRIDQATSSQFKFFKELNPDYQKGYGLQTIYPLSNRNFFFTVLNLFLSRLKMKYKFRKF